MSGETVEGFEAILWIVAFIVAVMWFFVPFAVFSISQKLNNISVLIGRVEGAVHQLNNREKKHTDPIQTGLKIDPEDRA